MVFDYILRRHPNATIKSKQGSDWWEDRSSGWYLAASCWGPGLLIREIGYYYLLFSVTRYTMTTVDKKDKGLVKNSFRGLTLDQLEKLNQEELVALFRARMRRRFSRSRSLLI